MKQFRDRIAVVTGGAGGIGKALVKAFLGEGMKVVIGDVEEPVLREMAAGYGWPVSEGVEQRTVDRAVCRQDEEVQECRRGDRQLQ